MRPIMIAAAVALLAIANLGLPAVQGGPIAGAKIQLKALCSSDSIDRLSVHDLESLADELNDGRDAGCPEVVLNAVRDMSRIVSESSSDLCSEQSVASIKEFYANYLEDDLGDVQLPKALERFALSYAMRMSQRCKANMAAVLSGEANELEKHEDFAAWAGKGGEMDQLLRGMVQPGELISPSDLAALIPNFDGVMQKMVVQSDKDSDVQLIKDVCDRRLRPIYGRLVRPVAELSRAGFDYPDEAVRRELALSQEATDRLDEWAKVVFLCEVMGMVETYKRSAQKAEPEVVSFVDEEGLKKLQGQLVEHAPADIELVNFERGTGVELGDFELLPNEELDELDRNLHSHKTPVDRLREKLRQNAMRLVADYTKGGDINSLLALLRSHSAEDDLEGLSNAEDKRLCGRKREKKRGADCGKLVASFFFAVIIFVITIALFS